LDPLQVYVEIFVLHCGLKALPAAQLTVGNHWKNYCDCCITRLLLLLLLLLSFVIVV